jgi:RNA polymerase sigma-70 factor (ECF subfamily)
MAEERSTLAHDMAERVARQSYGKLVAFIAARTRDVASAEDALSEAFAAALVDWPKNGCPQNPEAWLLTAARRKAIDVYRTRQRHDLAADEIVAMNEELQSGGEHSQIPDQRLALMFACAHPAIDAGIRAPLILQTVLGLDAKAIGSAFLMSPAAMSKRLVRAKEKIKVAGIPFVIPEWEELPEKIDAVLDAIYAAFTEGWTDPAGTDAARRDLAEESLFLARLVTELLPNAPEAHGLLALILYADGRRKARRTKEGEFVPLADQDTQLWDSAMITEAEELLVRAGQMRCPGRYQLEAALQSAHVHRVRTGEWNWPEILQLYDVLLTMTDSPVVALNRAVAVAEIDGPEAGLKILEQLRHGERLSQYQPYWVVRAELLSKIGEQAEARKAYEMAIGLEHDSAVRRFLQKRKASLNS